MTDAVGFVNQGFDRANGDGFWDDREAFFCESIGDHFWEGRWKRVAMMANSGSPRGERMIFGDACPKRLSSFPRRDWLQRCRGSGGLCGRVF
ncbi:MAG: hypothetical protein ACI8UZ_001069 [Akkermansiaceae bacterium]|jgi:hypothetical protein